MSRAASLAGTIRRDLSEIEARLLDHPYLAALEDRRVPREELRRLAGEQRWIIASDLRSVAHLVGRFGDSPARDFFLEVLQGERAAWEALLAFAGALGMGERELDAHEPLPGAHAYTCYMAWLALYGTAAEVAGAYLVNFPAWGRNCARLSRILRERYGLAEPDVAFFDLFARAPAGFEPAALAVIEQGLEEGVDARLVRRAARLLQGYELLFWDTLAEAAVTEASRGGPTS